MAMNYFIVLHTSKEDIYIGRLTKRVLKRKYRIRHIQLWLGMGRFS